MTIAGFTITAPDCAFVWADTEVFTENDTIRRADKIAIDLCNRMVAVGVGWRGVTLAAFDAFRRTENVDAVLRHLPGVMRHAAARVARAFSR